MRLEIAGVQTYAYTGSRAFDAALPTVVFVHGAAHDHSVWALQSRYFAHHARNVLAVDLPGHGRSLGDPPPTIEALAAWLATLLEALGRRRRPSSGTRWGRSRCSSALRDDRTWLADWRCSAPPFR